MNGYFCLHFADSYFFACANREKVGGKKILIDRIIDFNSDANVFENITLVLVVIIVWEVRIIIC